MSRYYFDVHDDDMTIDREGVDFADANAAIAYAYRCAREIAATSAVRDRLVAGYRIDIFDAHRRLIDTVTYGEAVGPPP